MKLFTAGERRLNSAYGFDFLYADRLTPQLVREAAEGCPDAPGVGWPSWAFENQDAPRALSRWTPEDVDPAAYARMNMRSDEHTSDLPSLMRTPFARVCFKNKKEPEKV